MDARCIRSRIRKIIPYLFYLHSNSWKQNKKTDRKKVSFKILFFIKKTSFLLFRLFVGFLKQFYRCTPNQRLYIQSRSHILHPHNPNTKQVLNSFNSLCLNQLQLNYWAAAFSPWFCFLTETSSAGSCSSLWFLSSTLSISASLPSLSYFTNLFVSSQLISSWTARKPSLFSSYGIVDVEDSLVKENFCKKLSHKNKLTISPAISMASS